MLIEGQKWCGKTTTAEQQSGSTIYLQNPKVKNYLSMSSSDSASDYILNGDVPRLIDEWQDNPEIWDAIRYEIDRRDEFGQFILTGSAVPPDTSSIMHSGAGRITRMLMRPMSLYESNDSTGIISLSDLFKGSFTPAQNKATTLDDIAFLLCRGGWPKSLGCSSLKIALAQALDYFDIVADSDTTRASGVERDPSRARLVMKSYARNIGTQISYSKMVDDIRANDNIYFSEQTLSQYIRDLKKIFIFEDCPSWNPNLRSRTAIRTTDTRYFCDPSVAAAALGAGPGDLINDLETFGLLFENMAMRDLRIYSQAIDGNIMHYRDKNNLECDAVVHLRNGDYGLIEIKLGGERLINDGIRTLTALDEKLDKNKTGSPSFRMILTAVGDYAYQTKEGIYIVPITMLGR